MHREQLGLFSGSTDTATETAWPPASWPELPPVPKPKPRKRFNSRQEYYRSPEWERVRTFALHRAKHRCQRCGARGVLQVHHLNYDSLYNEHPNDLEVLCVRCHKAADSQRASNNHYSAGRDTYMTKKYGEDWEERGLDADEFDDWLERKGDV